MKTRRFRKGLLLSLVTVMLLTGLVGACAEPAPEPAPPAASLPAPVWASAQAPGGVPEWLNGAVSKTVVGLSVHRGFESLPLRSFSVFTRISDALDHCGPPLGPDRKSPH